MQKTFVAYTLLLLGFVPLVYGEQTAQQEKIAKEETLNAKELERKLEKFEKRFGTSLKKRKILDIILEDNKLDFVVENNTGKTVYITCFAYMKKHTFDRWRWVKSPIYKLDDTQSCTVSLPPIYDQENRESTFGYLAVLDNQQAADNAIYELLPDENKLELDLLAQLKGKKVVLEVEKYGFKKDFLEYDFVPEDETAEKQIPSLNFLVENKTGKTIIIAGFIFEKRAKGTWLAEKTRVDWSAGEETRDDMSVWRFDKTPLLTLQNGQTGMVEVDTIIEKRDRDEVRGYLVIFDEDERREAEDATYELLPADKAKNKLQINKLKDLQYRKVAIEVDSYGIVDDIIDYKIKPISRIDFKKIGKAKKAR